MKETLHGYRILHSGELSLLYRNGEIRQVCLGRIQILNAVYAAVRDKDWNTIPFTTSDETIKEDEDGFIIDLELKYSQKEILYHARICIEAKGNRLIVKYDGKAKSTFLRNRIGLCILHPVKECRGEKLSLSHPDGNPSKGRFPELISPDQPFINLSGMTWTPGIGINAELEFDGEVFESEDQRNWTDSSYKTYGTPLEKPFPVLVNKGEQVTQSVTLVVEHKPESVIQSAPIFPENPTNDKRILSIHPGNSQPMPGLGIGRSTESSALSPKELKILSALLFRHYRVDLRLACPGWDDIYDSAAKEQKHLGWPLEMVLHFSNQAKQELAAFLKHYTLHPVKIRHFLIFDQDFISNNELLKLVIPVLKTAIPDILVGGGTDAYLAELNRKPPDRQLPDFISYSICPQVHANDNLTLVENLEAQPESVTNTRDIFSKPVYIGAITLKQRFNAVTTEHRDGSQDIPESDPRQHTNFAAAWTMSSIRNLALAGTASLTYFETVGPRGILSRPTSPGNFSPLFHLFTDLLTSGSTKVIRSNSSHPLEFDGLVIQEGHEMKILIANYTEAETSISITGVSATSQEIFKLDKKGWIPLEIKEPAEQSFALSPSGIYKITYSK